jgi:hypothetical protein
MIFAGCMLGNLSLGFVADFESYAGEIRPDGVSLLSLVEPFKEYGKPDLSAKEDHVRVIVIGAVLKPGIYHVKRGTAMCEVMDLANPIAVEGFLTRAYKNHLFLHRVGAEPGKIKIIRKDGQDDTVQECLDGDVLKILALRL